MGQVTWRWTLAMAALFSAFPLGAQTQNAEAPVPVPVLIFFDWGKPDIGKDAADQLEALAARYGGETAQRLRVTGHSDRSGGAAGNRRAAMQRAETVADYLAQRGVPRSAMSAVSLGEDQPLISTADGVREPQNRRVEIHVIRAP